MYILPRTQRVHRMISLLDKYVWRIQSAVSGFCVSNLKGLSHHIQVAAELNCRLESSLTVMEHRWDCLISLGQWLLVNRHHDLTVILLTCDAPRHCLELMTVLEREDEFNRV